MFVYSMRAGTVRFFAVICVALLVLVTLVALVPELQPVAAATDPQETTKTINYENVRSEEERVAFLSQFGWQVGSDPVLSAEVTIPSSFDKIFMGYNEIQKGQGLDLSKYKNKEVMRYTYEVTNYKGYNGVVYATLLIYRNKVIGGDVCSADPEGFIHGFEMIEK